MDLLGSILGSMEKPPTVDDQAKKKQKEQREKIEKHQARERQERSSFRLEIQTRINRFLQNDIECFRFEPMDKLRRTIVHEVAETAGMTSHAFGVEEEDRFVMLFKKEYGPTEDQLGVYRTGVTFDPKEVDEILRKREEERKTKLLEKKEERAGKKRKNPKDAVPSSSHYQAKYQHLIGTESAAAAAKSMNANAAYGFVTSENKKDKRSIEETLADIRTKKKLKNPDESSEKETDSNAEDSWILVNVTFDNDSAFTIHM